MPLKQQSRKCLSDALLSVIVKDVSEEENEDEVSEHGSTTKEFPQKLLENGMLLYKGKRLMKMMSEFYTDRACELCNETFQKLHDLFDHQKVQHGNLQISCCSIKLTKMPAIIYHYVRHVQPEDFRCPICYYTVSRPRFLQRHMLTHEPQNSEDNSRFCCDVCNKKFIWKGALRAHLLNHKPEIDRKDFTCTICNRKYLSAGSLSWHKKRAHSTNIPVQAKNLCEICSKTFATLTSFKEHMLGHSEESVMLQIQCPKCTKWLKNQRCLKSHMLLHAEDDYKCKSCNYTTKKEPLLKNHIITRHTSDRPFKCDECEKSFKVKRALTVHKVQNHTEGEFDRLSDIECGSKGTRSYFRWCKRTNL